MSVAENIENGKYHNKVHIWATDPGYKAEENEQLALFRSDLEAEHGLSNHPKRDRLWELTSRNVMLDDVRMSYEELASLLAPAEPKIGNVLDLFIYLRKTYPTLTGRNNPHGELTQPLHNNGFWQLDIDVKGRYVSVQWNDEFGFGVTLLSGDSGFGEAPEWHSMSFEETKARCDELIASQS